MDILVTSFIASIASRTPEPTRPVAPVRMRCMLLTLDHLRLEIIQGKIKQVACGSRIKYMAEDGVLTLTAELLRR